MSNTGNDHPTFRSVWLVTGGAGYVGGHVMQALRETRIPAVLLDIDTVSAQKKFTSPKKQPIKRKDMIKQLKKDIKNKI